MLSGLLAMRNEESTILLLQGLSFWLSLEKMNRKDRNKKKVKA